MKYGDAYYCNLNTLVYKYIATTYSMHSRDVIARYYAYSYNVFHNCSTLHQVTAPSTILISTLSINSEHHTLHHFSLHFLQSPTIFLVSTQPLRTEPVFITPENVTCVSFDCIVSSFGLLFHIGLVVLYILLPSKQASSIIIFLSILSLNYQTYYTNVAHFCFQLSRLQISFSSNPINAPAYTISFANPISRLSMIQFCYQLQSLLSR